MSASTSERSVALGLAVVVVLGGCFLWCGLGWRPKTPGLLPTQDGEIAIVADPIGPAPEVEMTRRQPAEDTVRHEDAPSWRGRELRLRVVEAGTGRPVPRVPVWLVRANSRRYSSLHHDRVEFLRHVLDYGWRFRSQGIRVTTDVDGYATWTADVGPEVEAFSERETWCGRRSFDVREMLASRDVLELELRPDVTVHLHVQDASGAPVEAQGEWRIWRADVEEAAEPDWHDVTIDRSGLGIRHLGLDDQFEDLASGRWLLQARARVPGTEFSVSEPLALTAGKTHVHLTLPALARVHLLWQDSTGAPLRLPTSAILRRADSEDRNDRLWQPLVDARASFAVVAGERYTVSLENVFVDENGWELVAPARAGTEERRVFRLPSSVATLSCRVLDVRGEPVADRRLLVKAQGASAFGSAHAETDAAGRAWLVLRSAWTNGGVDRAILTVWSAPDYEGQSADLAALGPLLPGTHDLGDVVLGAEQLLVAGEVRREVLPDGDNTWILIERLVDGQHWIPQRATVSWSDGRFEARGVVSPGECRVRARATRGSRRPSSYASFRPGATGVALHLERAAAVEIPVLLLPGEKAMLWVGAVPLAGDAMLADANERLHWLAEAHPAAGATRHSLWVSRLPAGRFRFDVRCGVAPGVVHAFEASVGEGEDTLRLPAVDLADHLRKVTVRVLAPKGLPVAKGYVVVFGEAESKVSRPIVKGVATLWLDRPRTVEVCLPDNTRHRFAEVFEETELRLRRGDR